MGNRRKKKNIKRNTVKERIRKVSALERWSPIYVVDTSGILDMYESDHNHLSRFLTEAGELRMSTDGQMYPGILVMDPIMEEVSRQYDRMKGRRRMLGLNQESRLALFHNSGRKFRELVTGHDEYDEHRYAALCTHLCMEEEAQKNGAKKSHDSAMSFPDTHVLAAAFTLGHRPTDFGLEYVFPVIISGDSHITGTASAMIRAGRHTEQKYRNRLIVLNTRT